MAKHQWLAELAIVWSINRTTTQKGSLQQERHGKVYRNLLSQMQAARLRAFKNYIIFVIASYE